MKQKVICLELNEVNFEYLEYYIAAGELSNFKQLIDQFGYCQTTSENEYQHLEPWIQWVTAHTGLSYQQHQVFRLGDGPTSNLKQIWEVLEEKNVSVAAISPINAANNTKNSPFFLPDPWVETTISGSKLLVDLCMAISQVVNDNAQGKMALGSVYNLLKGFLRYAAPQNYVGYINYVLGSLKKPWHKALFLDQLLVDVFINQWKKYHPDFSTLFLNAAAHIQHHYLFSAKAYSGPKKNPSWYIDDGDDPLLAVYKLYDKILGRVLQLSAQDNLRILIATGLHQEPYEEVTYYYRLKNHKEFLGKIGLKDCDVQPCMSRDFIINNLAAEQASLIEEKLLSVVDKKGNQLFEVDNRQDSLFVTLSYPLPIDKDFSISFAGGMIENFEDLVAFVAIKNGHHHAIGYLIDSKMPAKKSQSIPLTDIYQRLVNAFD